MAEKNRLCRHGPAVAPRIRVHIQWLEQKLTDLDQELRQTLRRSPVWREQDDLLRSVLGQGRNSPGRCCRTCPNWAPWAAGR